MSGRRSMKMTMLFEPTENVCRAHLVADIVAVGLNAFIVRFAQCTTETELVKERVRAYGRKMIAKGNTSIALRRP
jgi:hypothetical protein